MFLGTHWFHAVSECAMNSRQSGMILGLSVQVTEAIGLNFISDDPEQEIATKMLGS